MRAELRGSGCGELLLGLGQLSRLQRAARYDADIDEASGTHPRRRGGVPWSVEHGQGWGLGVHEDGARPRYDWGAWCNPTK